LSLLGLSAAGFAAAQPVPTALDWAYAIELAPVAPPVDDGTLHTLPGAQRSFTLDQIRNRMGPADWYPEDHPSMPPIVAVGREAAGVWACAMCHYPNGKGRPENAGIAGLPVEYFVQQMYDFKNGLRRSAEPRKANTNLMIGFAHAMTDAEIRQAAEYFGSMRWTPWIDVLETQTVPRTRIQGGMHLRLEGEGAGTEPLGARIVESPRHTERTELLRDPRAGFLAFVPVGAVAKGEALARAGGGKTVQCAVCHGEDLDGLALVPPLRGRSPSYIARQLYDFKTGARRGAWSALMTGVVADLTPDDILNLAAYLASLEPQP
jgi:cytochrome c553